MFSYCFGMIGTGHRRGYIYRGCLDKFLLMRFRNDFFIEVNGKVSYGKAGDFVLHAPGSTVAHGPVSKREGFVNDWMFFLTDPAEAEFIKQLPFDTPIPGDGTDRFVQCLSEILSEHVRNDTFSGQLISDHIYHMLTMVKRADTERRKHDDNKVLAQFHQLRMYFHKHCQESWTLPKMAEHSGYSVSHFSALYKELFGISPMEDLLNERLALAKRLISLKTYKISEVASLCGFSSLHYFSEYFKKKTGKAPSEY